MLSVWQQTLQISQVVLKNTLEQLIMKLALLGCLYCLFRLKEDIDFLHLLFAENVLKWIWNGRELVFGKYPLVLFALNLLSLVILYEHLHVKWFTNYWYVANFLVNWPYGKVVMEAISRSLNYIIFECCARWSNIYVFMSKISNSFF